MTAFNRRLFLNRLGVFSAASWFTRSGSSNWSDNLQQAIQYTSRLSATELADNEEFWRYVQQSYTASPWLINLNNGGVAPSPIVVQDAVKRFHDMCNEA